jgi:hypothetical protein
MYIDPSAFFVRTQSDWYTQCEPSYRSGVTLSFNDWLLGEFNIIGGYEMKSPVVALVDDGVNNKRDGSKRDKKT